MILKTRQIKTPLGPMVAVSDDDTLYSLEFGDRLKPVRTKVAIISSGCKTIDSIEEELNLYFDGKLQQFSTPLRALVKLT